MPEEAVVFAVLQADNGHFWLDPIVAVRYGNDQRYRTIPSLNEPVDLTEAVEAGVERFAETYYRASGRVAIFHGGERIGTAVVDHSTVAASGLGCVEFTAAITVAGPRVPLLATSSIAEVPGHPSDRRDATAKEEAIFKRLVAAWMREYGLDRKLLQRGTVGTVTATTLRKEAGVALIGRIDVSSHRAVHRLFAVAERLDGQYRLTLTDLQVQHDVEDGTDQSVREYLDQVDIDNDGIDEVISSATHYESWSYRIWSFDRRNQIWRQKFGGGGGGC